MTGSVTYPRPEPPLKGGFWVRVSTLALLLPSAFAAGIPHGLAHDSVKPPRDFHDSVSDGLSREGLNHLEARQNRGTTILFTETATSTVTVFATPSQPLTVVVTAKEGPPTTVSVPPSPPQFTTTSKSSTISTSTIALPSSSLISTLSRPPTTSTAISTPGSSTFSVQPPPAFTNIQRPAASSSSFRNSLSTSTTSSRTTSAASRSSAVQSQATFAAAIGAETVCVERLKIEDMQTQKPDSFNLLLLAWRELQLASERDDLSFYQLSRIHGAPFGPWQMPAEGNYNRQLGYCTHHSVIFLSWHRPFLLLLEQTLYRKAREIASRFSGGARTRYQAAAEGVRLPYWDWSDPNTQSHVPAIVTAATVSVTQPGNNGVPVTAFARWRTTLRQPTNEGVTQEDVADRTLQNGYTNRRQSTYLAFSSARYNDFAASIESIHDDVHAAIGGQGHMTYIPYSAYDPIFWLHHCNMDRLMAMYQSSHPNTFIEPANSVPTFANPSSQLDTVDTPLYPFRHRDGSWWTSQNISAVNTVFTSSYGYPEVPCVLSFANFDALRNHTITEINRLYGPSPVSPTKREIKKTQKRQEWQVKIVIDQAELLGSFIVYIFLGTPPADPTEWATFPKMIGTLTHLGFPQNRMHPRVIGNHVVLTDAIHQKLGQSPTKEEVLRYIRENINWTIVSDGKPVSVPQLHTLRVTCVSTEVTLPTCPDELPQKGSDAYHLEVTAGKPGGSKSECDVKSPFQINGQRAELPSHISLSE
ncbi:hypothetical protein TWF730_002747 [Orbilia blumenaviensis]|uniref:tyrosinase n=1 Tax=Orbilia blumenaviensis TaxID=1796055 RepID=A0AAV9U7U0_9PEZI